jgi:hypothetical protein
VPEVIASFTSRKGRPPKYPWEEWTDGRSRRLRRGEDFDADLVSFRTMVHRKARDLGSNIGAYTHINKADQSIQVRFYERDKTGAHIQVPPMEE